MLVPPDGRGTGRTRDWLPTGGTLPAAAFETRHRTVVILLWIHVLGLPLFAVARGYPWYHGLLDTSPILVCAVAAMSRRFNRRGRASIGALGLVTCSAIFTHLWGGVTEAHFHFFVVVALLSLYEDWVPWGLAIAYVLVHHGVMGAIDPRSVFGDNPSAQAPPVALGRDPRRLHRRAGDRQHRLLALEREGPDRPDRRAQGAGPPRDARPADRPAQPPGVRRAGRARAGAPPQATRRSRAASR